MEFIKNKIKNLNGDSKFKRQFLREYLQLLILKIIDEKNYFAQLAFVGGTALRLIHGLQRFSEDLDFSLIHKEKFNFNNLMTQINNELVNYNLNVEYVVKKNKTVAAGFVKFNDLLSETNLAIHPKQKLSIKLEVDQKPPSGYNCELTLINNDFIIGINTYDLSSLFAGKLHALLFRKYSKGRDYYDLLWFLSKKISPNYKLLNNAISQTQFAADAVTKTDLQNRLIKRLNETNFKIVTNELESFLIDKKELRFVSEKYLTTLIKSNL
jgi:predicted nucleotidyltransferase component of viral defense system